MNENKIAHIALERFTEQTGIKTTWKSHKSQIDGEVCFYLPNGKLIVSTIVKKELRQHQLEEIFEMAQKYQPFIVVAENIFPSLKECLKEKKIGYLDAAGNIYLNVENSFIWIEGNKQIENKTTANNRAFTKTGLKMVFYLLLDEQAINMTYRQLSNTTGVALGNVKNIIEGLNRAGFILRINDTTLQLQNKQALFNRWLTGYIEKLKPAIYLGTYRFLDKKRIGDWQALPLNPDETKWGGEPAGELLTDYLLPAHLTVYTNQKDELIRKWLLIPDTQGNIHFYEKFWRDEKQDCQQYAPPLLVYADLMLANDPRCQETATIIYNKYLKSEFH